MEPVDDPQLVGLLKLLPLMVGVGLTVMVVLAGADGQLPVLAVAITVYVPALAVVTPGITGFCKLLVNPPGPLQL